VGEFPTLRGQQGGGICNTVETTIVVVSHENMEANADDIIDPSASALWNSSYVTDEPSR